MTKILQSSRVKKPEGSKIPGPRTKLPKPKSRAV